MTKRHLDDIIFRRKYHTDCTFPNRDSPGVATERKSSYNIHVLFLDLVSLQPLEILQPFSSFLFVSLKTTLSAYSIDPVLGETDLPGVVRQVEYTLQGTCFALSLGIFCSRLALGATSPGFPGSRGRRFSAPCRSRGLRRRTLRPGRRLRRLRLRGYSDFPRPQLHLTTLVPLLFVRGRTLSLRPRNHYCLPFTPPWRDGCRRCCRLSRASTHGRGGG